MYIGIRIPKSEVHFDGRRVEAVCELVAEHARAVKREEDEQSVGGVETGIRQWSLASKKEPIGSGAKATGGGRASRGGCCSGRQCRGGSGGQPHARTATRSASRS